MNIKGNNVHIHEHKWIIESEGESYWLCPCGDNILQFEDCPGGR